MNFTKIKKFYICTNFRRVINNKSIFTRGISIVMIMLSISVFGQRHEIGIRAGGTSMVGDIGRTGYVQLPTLDNISELGLPIYFGALYRMNFNPHQTLRFNLGYSQMSFGDYYAQEQYRKNRRRYGSNAGIDTDILFEYNFFPVNNEQKGMLSPYVFGGIGASLYSVRQITFQDMAEDNEPLPILYDVNTGIYNTANGFTKKIAFTTPFGVGLKYKFNYNWAFSAEVMFRPMFTDTVDYSVINEKDTKVNYNRDNAVYSDRSTRPTYVEEAKRQVNEYIQKNNIGNKNSNDWVNTVSLSLTYSFGRPPCYCDQ